jgi:hypothetical protein
MQVILRKEKHMFRMFGYMLESVKDFFIDIYYSEMEAIDNFYRQCR